ncbi:MAG: HAD family hydrolase [Anaerolineales bacterium]
MIRAIIFDFDGLILETEEPVYQSWQEIFQEYGCTFTFDLFGAHIGTTGGAFNPLAELESQLGEPLPYREIRQRQQAREMELVLKRSILPGVLDYLESAKAMGLKIGLASSSECAWVTGHLSRLGLIDYFDSIKGSDDVQNTKPNPELFLASINDLGVSPDQAVVFEDSVNGIIAAKKAGLSCVWVPNILTSRLSTDLADLRLESLEDMPLDELLQIIDIQLR